MASAPDAGAGPLGGVNPNAAPAPDAGLTDDTGGVMPGDDPNAMPETPDEPGMTPGDQDDSDSTMDIINQLNPTDKEAVRAYAESMLSRDETTGGPEEAGQTPMGQEPAADNGIMMEITKGRLKKVQEKLDESGFYNIDEPRQKDDSRPQRKVTAPRGKKKSPFDSPFD